MSLFFNGKLWQTPTTMSKVDDSAMLNASLGVGNVAALLGTCVGGKPNTPLAFSSPDEAKAALRSGPLLDAILKAFAPSAETGGPSKVVGMRVNPAVPATAVLLDAGAKPAIDLKSTDFGAWTNQLKVKVQAGSISGVAITSQLGSNYFTQDNIGRNAFDVQYTGAAASARVVVTAGSVELQAPSGTKVATIDLTVFGSYSQVVDYINSVAGWTAVLSDSANEALPAFNALDFVTLDAKTGLVTVTAHLQAAIDWINGNSEGYLTATRSTGAGAAPAPVGFTYLQGGSDGVTTVENWGAAFTALQSIDVQWLTPVSTNPAIWSMADAHAQYMSKYASKERRCIVGTAAGTTKDQAKAYAKALNSDRTSLVHVGYYDFDANGKLVLFNASYMAALLTGMFAGVNPGTALSNKSITVQGLEFDVRNPTDTDELLPAGVLCVENTQNGYKVVQSISTWRKDSKFNRVEQSCGWAADYTARTLREAVDVVRGEKNMPVAMGRAKTLAVNALNALAKAEPEGPGILAGDADNPAWKDLRLVANGDTLAISCQASPVIPINYIPVSISLQIYTGSISA